MMTLAITAWCVATAFSIAGIVVNAVLLLRVMRLNREADAMIDQLRRTQERYEYDFSLRHPAIRHIVRGDGGRYPHNDTGRRLQ